MQQDQDTCRICSGPGEPDQPLFYPCKCSGTIRYIHQDCLKTWLDHSKKSSCDVCKHPYAFTKVYRPDMPERVPVLIIARKIVQQIIAVILFILRTILVALVWLTLLPYGTVLTWRLYFRMGDILAWWISLHPRLPPAPPYSISNGSLNNTSPNRTIFSNVSVPLQLPLSEILSQTYLRNLSADIFTGQIIASLIVLAFLAIFLLREWIQQNARPGVFDDGPGPEVPAPIDPPHPQPEPEPAQIAPVPAAISPDEEARAQAASAPGVAGPLEMGAPGMTLAPRPVPDVPEDVRPAGPSSSSCSSSDTEGPSPRPAPTARSEQSSQTLDSCKNERSKRRLSRGVTTSRKRRMMRGGESEAAKMRARRSRKEEGEHSHWELQADGSSDSHASGASDLFEDESHLIKPNNELVDQGHSETDSDSEAMFPPGFKSRQKRKADESDTEATSRHSSPRSTRRSVSPSTADFQFTFQPPRLPSEQNCEFKLEPMKRSISESGMSFSRTSFTFIEASSSVIRGSSSEPLSTWSDIAPNADTTSSSYASVTFHPLAADRSVPGEDISDVPAQSSYPLSDSKAIEDPSSQPTSHTSSQLPDSSLDHSHLTLTLHRSPLPSPKTTLTERDADALSSSVSTAPPSSASYTGSHRPPEELQVEDEESTAETGHTSPEEHGGEDDDDDDDDDARLAYYFREPEQDEAREAPPHLLPDTDDEEDEDDVHDGGEPREGALVGPQVVPLAAGDVAGQNEDADVADDEREQNLEDEFDGAMEAVGLRGPVFALFQNAALMLFILNVSIAGGIWVPFTLGKTLALLTLEPRRALQIMHLPIRAVRLVTDPSVDAIIYCLRFLGSFLLISGKGTWTRSSKYVGAIYRTGTLPSTSFNLKAIDVQRILTLFTFSNMDKRTVPQPTEEVSWTNRGLGLLAYVPFPIHDKHLSTLPPILSKTGVSAFQLAEEYLAILGRYVRVAFTVVFKEWVELAEGDGTIERLWAIFLGYAVAAFLAALYLNTITVGNVRSVGRAVRDVIRQQMIVLKVALFIVVELVMFPFGCGAMLDFSTLVLFPDATIESRLAFFTYAPVTAAFYHWLIGTMFMYQFAILLATCRELLRPGCMWFIKDPQDPTFHPIRDILDRPTLSQLRKLCMSAVMYAVVILFGVGSIIWGLSILAPLFPLRWKMREPLSEIPVDLLFVHLILPPTLHYFRPKKPVRRLLTAWWQWTAHKLRLTSFMFGGRHPDEEFQPVYWSWWSLLPGYNDQSAAEVTTRDGGFRRAPAGDNIAFLRDRPALVEVDENGAPLDALGHEILLAQNAEAQQAGRNFRDDYTIVYVPPNFRRRIVLFILLFWLSGSIAMISAVAVPIFAGRAVFGLFTMRELHDGYSFVAGFYLLWWSWLVGSLIVRIRIRRQRHGGSKRIRAGWFLFLIKRVAVYVSKITWLVLWLGVVLPTLVSIVVDLYLIIPIRYFLNPEFTPTIHIFESWATGLILSKIIIRTQRTRPGMDLSGALDAIQRNGWRRPDPWAATKDFIIPVGIGLTGMVLLPPMVVYGCFRMISIPWRLEDLFRFVYPTIFIAVAAIRFVMSLGGVFAKWTQGIRDKEFLLELRLRNLDYPRKPEKQEASAVDPADDQENAHGEDD